MFAARSAVIWPGPSNGGDDLDDVAADQRETGEPANQLLRFVAGQAADFRRPGARRERRIDRIDVERHVGRRRSTTRRMRSIGPRDAARP